MIRWIVLALLVVVCGCITQKANVTKVIDGDTIEISTGERIRLVGINTPEKGELCYNDAKSFMESIVLGKEVGLVVLGKDKYGRTLGEVYYTGENINLVILKNGLANIYYSEDVDWQQYRTAEREGRVSNGCIWKKSSIAECIEVERVGNLFMLQNVCNITIVIDVLIRDTSASHRFNRQLNIKPYGIVKISEECGTNISDAIYLCQHVFNEDGDELFIYDKTGLLEWVAYGKYTNN